MRLLLSVVLAALVAGQAGAETYWGNVLKGDTHKRDLAVEEGNLYLRDARRQQGQLDRGPAARSLVQTPARAALKAYERALTIGPEDVDVHYRALAAAVLIGDAGPELCSACRYAYEAVIRHVEAIRRIDPNDTREAQFTWHMAIVLSKLGGMGGPDAAKYFERAVKEYESWRQLIDETSAPIVLMSDLATSYGNAAELLMAVGRLQEAIDMYRTAIELNPLEALGYFGLAVAYDRDGQWEKAVATMREAFTKPHGINRLSQPNVFFVPAGDDKYYHALAQQIKGTDREYVAALYTAYLSSARDSRYHERAREHLAELARGAAAGK